MTEKVICINRESLSLPRILSAHHLIAEINQQLFVTLVLLAAQIAHNGKEVKSQETNVTDIHREQSLVQGFVSLLRPSLYIIE